MEDREIYKNMETEELFSLVVGLEKRIVLLENVIADQRIEITRLVKELEEEAINKESLLAYCQTRWSEAQAKRHNLPDDDMEIWRHFTGKMAAFDKIMHDIREDRIVKKS